MIDTQTSTGGRITGQTGDGRARHGLRGLIADRLGLDTATKRGAAAGVLFGGIPGLLTGALAGLIKDNDGLGGLLSSDPMSINNIGSGLTNVHSVYGTTTPGMQANTSQNGTVTALGNGKMAVTNKWGVTTVMNADGTGQAADWSGRSYGANSGASGGTAGGGIR